MAAVDGSVEYGAVAAAQEAKVNTQIHGFPINANIYLNEWRT
jgi:hypothetical protein